jgi:putative protease
VRAYRLLRDEGSDPRAKKAALELLSQALGRSTTHYNFLPQRPRHPVDTDRQTGSGLFVGKVRGSARKTFLQPRRPLLRGDKLRIGYEDARGHHLYRLKKAVPARGRFTLPPAVSSSAPAGTPVFLTDRREPVLQGKIEKLEKQLKAIGGAAPAAAAFRPGLPAALAPGRRRQTFLTVFRGLSGAAKRQATGLWLNADSPPPGEHRRAAGTWWWLPPVIWPEEEESLRRTIDGLVSRGARFFVLNAPWQTVLFTSPERLTLWAGPFCNITNALAVDRLRRLGFHGAVASPELGEEDYRHLAAGSCLPLGIVVSGSWPLGISRMAPANLKAGEPFSSPRGEQAWFVRHGSLFWLFPNWRVDLGAHTETLRKLGYRLFIHLAEPVPPGVTIKKRAGLWNWKLGLK